MLQYGSGHGVGGAFRPGPWGQAGVIGEMPVGEVRGDVGGWCPSGSVVIASSVLVGSS